VQLYCRWSCLLARKPNTHTRIWKLTETQQKQTQIRNCIVQPHATKETETAKQIPSGIKKIKYHTHLKMAM
jgi:phosphoribosylaminoimidazole carboxylase (NCAIR synthetase)